MRRSSRLLRTSLGEGAGNLSSGSSPRPIPSRAACVAARAILTASSSGRPRRRRSRRSPDSCGNSAGRRNNARINGNNVPRTALEIRMPLCLSLLLPTSLRPFYIPPVLSHKPSRNRPRIPQTALRTTLRALDARSACQKRPVSVLTLPGRGFATLFYGRGSARGSRREIRGFGMGSDQPRGGGLWYHLRSLRRRRPRLGARVHPTAVCTGVDPLLLSHGSAAPHTNPAFPMLPSKRRLMGWLNCYDYRCTKG